jgi:hypothetical protein
MVMTSVFRKNAIFAENWRKSQKIVVITLTPGTYVISIGGGGTKLNMYINQRVRLLIEIPQRLISNNSETFFLHGANMRGFSFTI